MKLAIFIISAAFTLLQNPAKPINQPITIAIQPFNDMADTDINFIALQLKKYYPKVVVLSKIAIPKMAYYEPRNRYRADSLLKFFSRKQTKNVVYIGLTNKDISASRNNIPDFGIMGLGYRPGIACVASSYRLNKKNKQEEFFKVAIHELGHTQGLKHCAVKTCFMRDAKGKNHTREETDFCEHCSTILRLKGWQL